MQRSSEVFSQHRRSNARALSAFGVASTSAKTNAHHRVVRDGQTGVLFTIGYERRDANSLLAALAEAGVRVLVDVRRHPVSRLPAFRHAALQKQCASAGIEYVGCPDLGSTESQREELEQTGDIEGFRRRFRAYARRWKMESVSELARRAQVETVALLCYERMHDECHRSVVADLVAECADLRVVAIH